MNINPDDVGGLQVQSAVEHHQAVEHLLVTMTRIGRILYLKFLFFFIRLILFTLLFDLLRRAAILLFLLNLSEEFVSRISKTWMLLSASSLIMSVIFLRSSSGSSRF